MKITKEQATAKLKKYNKILGTTSKVIGSVVTVGGIAAVLGWDKAAAKGIEDPSFSESDLKPEEIKHSTLITDSSQMSMQAATELARKMGGANSYFEYDNKVYPSLYQHELPDPRKGLPAGELPSSEAIVKSNEHAKSILNDYRKSIAGAKDVEYIDHAEEPTVYHVENMPGTDITFEIQKARALYGANVIVELESPDGTFYYNTYSAKELEEIKKDPQRSAQFEQLNEKFLFEEPPESSDNNADENPETKPTTIEIHSNPNANKYATIDVVNNLNEVTFRTSQVYNVEKGVVEIFADIDGDGFPETLIANGEFDDDGQFHTVPLGPKDVIEMEDDADQNGNGNIDGPTEDELNTGNLIRVIPSVTANDEPAEDDLNTYEYNNNAETAQIEDEKIHEFAANLPDDEEIDDIDDINENEGLEDDEDADEDAEEE